MTKRVADGVEYGPTDNGKSYKCLFYHRGKPTQHKSTWSDLISTSDEYGVFCTADAKNWVDDKGHYWSLRDKGETQLGTQGERIAKFPKNGNAQLPWHGYPASPNRKDGDLPPKAVLQMWEDTKVIARHVLRRLRGSKI